jgi:hypothetical protein
MATFDEFWKALKKELIDFADYSWKEQRNAAIKDGTAFLEKAKSDLKRWTTLLASGVLTADDFEWLVAGKKDLAELVALKRKGLSQVARDRFINGLIDTIVATAFKIFA